MPHAHEAALAAGSGDPPGDPQARAQPQPQPWASDAVLHLVSAAGARARAHVHARGRMRHACMHAPGARTLRTTLPGPARVLSFCNSCQRHMCAS